MACPAGKTIGIWMFSATGSSLNYFQDFNPCRECLSLFLSRSCNDDQADLSSFLPTAIGLFMNVA